MAILRDSIRHGETYGIFLPTDQILGYDGQPYPLDGCTAALVMRRDKIDGPIAAEVDLTVTPEVGIRGEMASTEPGPGLYWYNLRITDADGHDHQSEPVSFAIQFAPTPPSFTLS